jgi:hypothetical protein
MAYFSRMTNCEGARDIGAWLNIMELLSIICIPVNVAIIYFTGDGSYTKEGTSSMVKYIN